jgi:FixJ family two-component response regulator
LIAVPTIAVVDDDPGVRGSIDSLIRSAGMTSLVFSRALDFLEYINIANVDCLLTDVHMPIMSGLDLQQELTRRGKALPTIFMTAYPTDALRNRALAGGSSAFLVKPIDPGLLLATVRTALTGVVR